MMHGMRTYTYSEARQRLATLLDQARKEGQVRIRRQDGSTFVVQPLRSEESPLDVRPVRSRLRPGELVDLVRLERERSGNAILDALSPKRPRRPAGGPRPHTTGAKKSSCQYNYYTVNTKDGRDGTEVALPTLMSPHGDGRTFVSARRRQNLDAMTS
jgi:hypothetical protein